MNEASPLYVMGCDWYFPLSDSHQEFSTRAFQRPLWELHRVHPKLSLFLVRDYIPPATEVHLLCRPSGVFNHTVCCGGREHFCLSSTGSRCRSFLRQCLLLKGPRMFLYRNLDGQDRWVQLTSRRLLCLGGFTLASRFSIH